MGRNQERVECLKTYDELIAANLTPSMKFCSTFAHFVLYEVVPLDASIKYFKVFLSFAYIHLILFFYKKLHQLSFTKSSSPFPDFHVLGWWHGAWLYRSHH